jgi:hypothetical protein
MMTLPFARFIGRFWATFAWWWRGRARSRRSREK